MYVCMYVCIRMYVCMYTYVCMYVCMYVYLCIYVCILMYICIIYIQNQPRMEYSAVYRRERPAQYQPECRARRVTKVDIGRPRAAIYGRVRPPRLVVYLLYLESI